MFIDGFEHYLTQEEGLSPATARKYTLDVQALWRWLEGQPSAPTSWADVTARHLRAFMAAQKPAPARTRRLIAAWRKFWLYLADVEKVGGLHPGPAELKRPKLPARLPRHLTVAEVKRLLDAALRQPNTKRALRDWAVLAFLYGSGCRISEALSLTFNRIQYDADRLPVSVRLIGKGDKERQIALSSTAQRALHQWLKVRKIQGDLSSPYVFSTLEGRAAGQPFSIRTIEAVMQRLGDEAGLDPELCSPHKLRHAHATALLDAGRRIEEVRELLGHASIATTQVYAHVSAARLDHAAASLPDVLDLAP